MSYLGNFKDIKIKNINNKFIFDEFTRYYDWIYSNYAKSNKSSKENYYKLLVIKKTIEIIAKFSKDILSGSDLSYIKGIGPKTVNRINEIINTGKLSEINEGKNQINAIKELSEIYGIGPVKASEFYTNFNITNLKELLKAYKNNKIEFESNSYKLKFVADQNISNPKKTLKNELETRIFLESIYI
jgi:predicted flap endonuclease-1-like 5' DNA nuclease